MPWYVHCTSFSTNDLYSSSYHNIQRSAQTQSFIDECLSRNNTNKNVFDLTPTTLHHQAKQDICRYSEQSSSRISFCSGGTSKQSGKLSLFFLEKRMTRTILCSLQAFASINPQAAGFNLFWLTLKCPSNLPSDTIRSQAAS